MVIFHWDPMLETGIALVDQQHKNIMNRANAFFIAYKSGHPQRALQDCLLFLEQYVMYHFQCEETYQVECKFPGFLNHRAQHERLKMQFKFHDTALKHADFSTGAVDDFYTFMREWIGEHILSEDLEFIKYYKAHLPKPQ